MTPGATAIARDVRSGAVSARSVVESSLQHAESLHRRTNAFFTLDPRALDVAADLDRRRARGDALGPLAGVPVAVKDNLVVEGDPCTCGSRILAGYRGTYTATVVERLRAAGAVVIGRTNMDEFGMGSSTETCAHGPVRNPWDLGRVPGGSSGGSAAAVAGGAVPVALGSDTGGSIRLPASYTGLVGLKPSYGRVSRYGLVAYASSTDGVGPLTRDVADAALLLDVLSGLDPHDPTSRPSTPGAAAAVGRGVAGLRIGVLPELGAVDPDVRACFEAGLSALEAAGAVRVPVALPALDAAVATYYVLAPAEAAANLARFDGMRYGARVEGADVAETIRASRSAGFGAEVKRRILVGTYVSSAGYADAYYRSAQRARARLIAELKDALTRVDVVATPTAATVAFRLGERNDPLEMYATDRFTVPASLAGLPAISVPCGLSRGLPVGLHLFARDLDEATLLAAAAVVEAATGPLTPPPADAGYGGSSEAP